MTKADKIHWTIVLVYGGILCLSLAAFLAEPRLRIAFVAQTLGPTFGTLILLGFTLVQMAGKRISLACGIGAILFLVIVSFICLGIAGPIFMGV